MFERLIPKQKLRWIAYGIAIPLGALLMAEAVLRVVDFRFVSFYLDSPLMVPAGDGRNVTTDPMFTVKDLFGHAFAHPQNFETEKAPGVVRVVLLGESSVRNLGDATLLLTQLADKIKRPVEVLNFGFGTCGSERIAALFKEALQYHPDAAFVYVGHNEFTSVCNPATRLSWRDEPMRKAAPPLRIVQLLWRVAIWLWHPKKYLDFNSLVRRYDETAKKEFYETFRGNLTAISETARHNGVALVLSTLAYSYGVRPWYGSASAREDELILSLIKEGKRAKAKATVERALIEAPRPDRANLKINAIITAVAREHGATLLDFHSILASESHDDMPGEGQFMDNCHLNRWGNGLLMTSAAKSLAAALPKP